MTARRDSNGRQPVWARRWRRLAWLVVCNLASAGVGLAAVMAGGEAWRRLTVPFGRSHDVAQFVPGVGVMPIPHAEARKTNQRDFWTVTRANSLGFFDREPPARARAASACHVAVIGDSFVEAMQVPVEDKLQVRLEALAAARVPELDVLATAFGRSGSGQVAQLAFYDEYVRPLAPKLVVLVFVDNDFIDNFTPLEALAASVPNGLGYRTAVRDGQGGFQLVPPSPASPRGRSPSPKRWLLSGPWSDGRSPVDGLLNRVEAHTWFGRWLAAIGLKARRSVRERILENLDRTPHLATAWDDLSWVTGMAPDETLQHVFARPTLPPALASGLDYTAFALAQFKARAHRDGFSLVMLATNDVGATGTPMFDRIARLASDAGIEIINLHDHITRQGGRVDEARWKHDSHWTPRGHLWAAEALLEYLARRQGICASGNAQRAGFVSSPETAAPETGPREADPA